MSGGCKPVAVELCTADGLLVLGLVLIGSGPEELRSRYAKCHC